MHPMMCSYKVVLASFEVWGLQGRVESYVHKVVRDVLVVGHLQAFAWIDEWFGKQGSKYISFFSSLLSLSPLSHLSLISLSLSSLSIYPSIYLFGCLLAFVFSCFLFRGIFILSFPSRPLLTFSSYSSSSQG